MRLSPHLLDEVLRSELHGAKVLTMAERRKARCAICRARFYWEKPETRYDADARHRAVGAPRPLCGKTYCRKVTRVDGTTCA